MTSADQRLAPCFERLVAHRRLVLTIALVCTVTAMAGLHRLVKDTSVDAFIPQDHPSMQADRKVADVFGLGDPIAVAVSRTDESSIFTPEDLRAIDGLTQRIMALPQVRKDRVTSIATESAIHGSDGALMVDPYIGDARQTIDDSRAAEQLWYRMPPHKGTLVADDASGAVILAELAPGYGAADAYRAILELTSAYERPGLEIMVAGPAAVSGLLSQRIDEDARGLRVGLRPWPP